MSNDEKMFYCTFGGFSPHANCVQPILAPGEDKARAVMFEKYDDQWMTSYSEEIWNKWLREKPTYLPAEKELPVLRYSEVFEDGDPS